MSRRSVSQRKPRVRAYPQFALNPALRSAYGNDQKLPVLRGAGGRPIAPFGTHRDYNWDKIRSVQPKYLHRTKRPIQGAPNWPDIWQDYTQIGTGYQTQLAPQYSAPVVSPVLGTITFMERLGEGSFAEVRRVEARTNPHDPHEEPREYACKILNLQPGRDLSRAVAAMFADIRAVAGLQHPGLCRIDDVVECADPDTRFPFIRVLIFMELCPATMRFIMDSQTEGMPEGDFCNLMRGAMTGLHYLHANRVAHLDIKPNNVLLSDTGTKLADFGLSIRYADNRPMVLDKAYNVGTRNYMAPEFGNGVRDFEATPCDVYASGRMFAEALVGVQNFHHLLHQPQGIGGYLSRVAANQFPPNLPIDLAQPISSPMARFVLDMTADNPGQRPDINAILQNPLMRQ